MNTDYYSILELSKDCTDQDIKKNYKRLAAKWHPDKNPDNLEESNIMFKKITEAYEVLSDPEKRNLYDNPIPKIKNMNMNDIFGHIFKRKSPNNIINLICNLEDLYTGTVKKVKIARKLYDKNLEEEITIDILAGYKEGTRIIFSGKAECLDKNFVAGDLIFVIKEKQHDQFVRDGDNLIMNMNISLKEALFGFTRTIQTVSGKKKKLTFENIPSFSYQFVLDNEGMPIRHNQTYGKLVIKFVVEMPNLSNDQKNDINKIL